jgi:hypothetical protein
LIDTYRFDSTASALPPQFGKRAASTTDAERDNQAKSAVVSLAQRVLYASTSP